MPTLPCSGQEGFACKFYYRVLKPLKTVVFVLLYHESGLSTFLRADSFIACLEALRCPVLPRLIFLAPSKNSAALCKSPVVAKQISPFSRSTMICLGDLSIAKALSVF